jgi:hypothetical protein
MVMAVSALAAGAACVAEPIMAQEIAMASGLRDFLMNWQTSM